MNRTNKEMLLHIITNKGHCYMTYCTVCPINHKCVGKQMNLSRFITRRYKDAVKEFIKLFGKEELVACLV